jgi:hypothetical protein
MIPLKSAASAKACEQAQEDKCTDDARIREGVAKTSAPDDAETSGNATHGFEGSWLYKTRAGRLVVSLCAAGAAQSMP